jgi:pantothenate kinase
VPEPITFAHLVARAAELAAGPGRAVLGVTGSPGAGKSTLVEVLLRELPAESVAHVPMDGFHLADAELVRLGRRDRKGAPDTFDAAGYAALLRRLRADGDETVYAPSFERDLEQPIAGSLPVTPAARLVVTEGNYLLLADGDWALVRPQLTEVWFCELPEAERIRRLVARHVRFGKSPAFAEAWVHGTDQRNADLVAGTRDRADLVVGQEVLDTIGGVSRGSPPTGPR